MANCRAILCVVFSLFFVAACEHSVAPTPAGQAAGAQPPAFPPIESGSYAGIQRLDYVRALDAVAKACPGFAKYPEDVQFDQLRGEEARINLDLTVVARPVALPSEFKAMGNRCFVEVSYPDMNLVTLSKRACMSVCLGNASPWRSSETVFTIAVR